MADEENTPQARDAKHGNGRVAECEPHCLHLLEAHSAELLAECHRYKVYLTLCGEKLPVSELPSSLCEPGCERMVTYCQNCLRAAVKHNADAGLAWSPPGARLLLDSWAAT